MIYPGYVLLADTHGFSRCLSTCTSNFAELYKISFDIFSNITSITSLNTRVSTECVWHVSENCFGDQQLTELLQQSTDLRKANRIEAHNARPHFDSTVKISQFEARMNGIGTRVIWLRIKRRMELKMGTHIKRFKLCDHHQQTRGF
jgi:hypothetical protein